VGNRRPHCTRRARITIIGISLAALVITPLIGASEAGAIGRATNVGDVSLAAHATRHCGSVTFIFSPTNPVTYFQVNAIGVSCAVAKHVLVKGGKYGGVPPAGWSYVNAGPMGTSNCFIIWKHGSERVVAYRQNVDGEGC
jgi:hypothetical protein